ncbi:hypothetical protein ABBQ38_011088 [Trebouxia sp. C0009 RCD-2024]
MVSSLSDELWGEIFALLAEQVADELTDSLMTGDATDTSNNYIQYHSLRLVCKRFQAVFLSYPTLSADLFLQEDLSETGLLSLLYWLRREDVTVRRLLVECSSTRLDVALAIASTAANFPLKQLTVAIIPFCSFLSLSMLSTCTALESCTFTDPTQFSDSTQSLDVSALQVLPRLSFLRLQGGDTSTKYCGIDRLAHLTGLEVTDTVVQSRNPFLFSSALQSLHLKNSDILSAHEDGLFQCTALLSLSLTNCSVFSLTAEHVLDIEASPARLPDSLSRLSHLTHLQLDVFGTIVGQFSCLWLPKLTALKQLSLRFFSGTMCFNMTDEILCLTNLQHLKIDQKHQKQSPEQMLYFWPETVLSLQISWHLLPMLQTVSFSSRFLKFDHRVLGLVEVNTLQSLEFGRCQLLDDETTSHFDALMYNLAVRRPDVVCHMMHV